MLDGLLLQIALDEENEGNMVTAVKWDSDGKYIALGTSDGTVRVSLSCSNKSGFL